MYNNRGSNYNDSNDSKLLFRSTPKKSENYSDRKQIEKRVDNDTNNVEKLNDKIDSIIISSEENNKKLEYAIQCLEHKVKDLKNEKETLNSEIKALNDRIDSVKSKTICIDSLELKVNALSSENKKLTSEINGLKQSLKMCQEGQNKNFETFMEKAVNDLQSSFSSQIKQMTKTIESSYSKKTKSIKDIISTFANNVDINEPKNESMNDSNVNLTDGEQTEDDSESDESSQSSNNVELNTNYTEEVSKSKTVEVEPSKTVSNVTSVSTTSSIFGSANNESGSIFGSNQSIKPMFGSVPVTTSTPLLFGNNAATTTVSVPTFGINTKTSSTLSSLIGNSSTTSLFGNSTLTGTAVPLFGSNVTPTIFGKSSPKSEEKVVPPVNNSTTSSIFSDLKASNNSTNLFKVSEKPSLFSSTTPVFGSSTAMQSFSSVSGSGFGSGSTETNWQGGSKLFSSSKKEHEEDEDDQSAINESDEHGPHFEPVIELPPLVEIVRDDVQNEVLFKARCKLYGFIENEWKDRGVGDMKVLRSTVDGKVTMVMRREQVHRVCCNQRIMKETHQFKPMGSEKSVCWFARDFTEGLTSVENFAARFSDKATVDELSRVVAEVQAAL